jgi:two-component system response regulator (stage 0 sporulation protein F)
MSTELKVLVVDDDTAIRETMWDILTLEGYDVEQAEDGEQAVAKCRDSSYDVVLLDIGLPGMNGIEALRHIRAIDDRVRVIMITGYDGNDLTNEAMAAGAEAIFRKPLDVASFLPVLLAAEDTL